MGAGLGSPLTGDGGTLVGTPTGDGRTTGVGATPTGEPVPMPGALPDSAVCAATGTRPLPPVLPPHATSSERPRPATPTAGNNRSARIAVESYPVPRALKQATSGRAPRARESGRLARRDATRAEP